MFGNKQVLQEYLSPEKSRAVVESVDDGNGKKNLYMKGVFIQGDVKNANERIYPVNEISRAVKTMEEIIKEHGGILGEVDHPDDLKINLDRVSHMITEMWMDGPNGYGKFKILPTPMGQLVKTMLESGVKLGVSSRGSGEVDANGDVQGFEIITVDVVAQPSAPGAYPTPIYEHLMNTKGGYKALLTSKEVQGDKKAQQYLKESLLKIIGGLQ
jgi:hypothetical protein